MEYLNQHHTASAAELSRHLRVSEANIRYHLKLLEQQGLVQLSSYQHQPGRGRPRQVYSLTPRGRGDNFLELNKALLEAVGSESPEILRQAAKILAALPSEEQTGALSQRLYHAVNRLNQLNYHAHWEARRGFPRLTFENCPYAQIIAEQPRLCLLDLFLVEILSGVSARQTKKLERSRSGTLQCEFHLQV